MYGQTDLYDHTLRLSQLWARFRALPPWAPVWAEIDAAFAKAEQQDREHAIEDALNRYRTRS